MYQLLGFLGFNSPTVILDGNDPFSSSRSNIQLDPASCMAQGIAQQVQQQLADTPLIGVYPDAGIQA
ncbi:hypothetical protein D3C75_1336600 [compost metagenome]